MKYIGREGELGLETDMGTRVGGAKFERVLAEDWDLDLEALSRRREGSIRSRRSPKLVHNLIFSMPPGTPPKKVLRAVQRLAFNEWQLRHRYAMTLHTDTAHPHVHVVLKAMSEQGERLNIRKSTLRAWRSQFAANLREIGVPANATERAVRGQSKVATSDGLYRTTLRGESSRMEAKRREMLSEIRTGAESPDASGNEMRRTRAEVVNGWKALASAFRAQGDHSLADGIRIFTGGMHPPMTQKELLAQQVMRGMEHGRVVSPTLTARIERNRAV